MVNTRSMYKSYLVLVELYVMYSSGISTEASALVVLSFNRVSYRILSWEGEAFNSGVSRGRTKLHAVNDNVLFSNNSRGRKC